MHFTFDAQFVLSLSQHAADCESEDRKGGFSEGALVTLRC